MKTKEYQFDGSIYVCRIVQANDGEELVIAPTEMCIRDRGNTVKLWGGNVVDIVIYGTEKTLDAYKFNLPATLPISLVDVAKQMCIRDSSISIGEIVLQLLIAVTQGDGSYGGDTSREEVSQIIANPSFLFFNNSSNIFLLVNHAIAIQI